MSDDSRLGPGDKEAGSRGGAPDDLAAIARKYALQNAAQHGQADAKSCMGRVMGAHPDLRSRAGDVMAALEAAVAEVNAMDPGAVQEALAAEAPELSERKKKERKEGLKPLPGAEKGQVVLRFAPNPNGPLSLGHSRGVAVMAAYAKEYEGEVVLRFDDTDPQVKPPLYDPAASGTEGDAYAMIAEDWEWLAGRPADRVVKASDRLEVYYAAARDLIDADGAYVCTCDAEEWRTKKNQGEACGHRDAPTEEQQEAFTKMVEGGFSAGDAVLRVKTDIQHKDPALRDWTAFRIVKDAPVHPREAAGEIDHFVCWPLLDFESAVEDHEQGVTHILRGKDLMDSTKKQRFLYDHLGWDYPQTLYWGRVRVHEFGKFSTSMMRAHIEDGQFTGWDDPRLPTLRALRRRGFTPEALQRFWVSLGLTEKDIAVSMENLEAENSKDIDPAAPRFFFVPDPHELSVSGITGKIAEPLVHPNDEARGRRRLEATDVVLIPDDEKTLKRLRLKDLGNVVLMGGTAMWAGSDMDRDVPIIQWLPKDHAEPFSVLWPETLPEDAPEGATPGLRTIEGRLEPAALEHVGEVVQFERFGFVRIEDQGHGVWLHD